MSLSKEARETMLRHIANDEPGVFQTWLKVCLEDLIVKDKRIAELEAELVKAKTITVVEQPPFRLNLDDC